MNVKEFLEEKGVRTVGTENEHVGEGWIGVDCPFCAEHNRYHLGISREGGGCKCWRCGKHRLPDVLKALGLSPREAFDRVTFTHHTAQEEREPPEELWWPPGCRFLQARHRKYLRQRGFRSRVIEQRWGRLRGTNVAGGKWRARLVVPVFYKREPVSWTARDITGQADLRYLSCPRSGERRPIKHCLYGEQLARSYTRVLVVEGVTDCWRFGAGAVSVMGTAWTYAQVAQLTAWDTVYILFDNEPEAQAAADELAAVLDVIGVNVEILQGEDKRDVGDYSAAEVRALRRELHFEL